MMLSFDEPSILQIVSNMLGEPFNAINEQVTDAVGELTNMISGGAKQELAKRGYQFEMALPITIVGRDVDIHPTPVSNVHMLAVPFDTGQGRFVVQAYVGNKK